MWVLLKESGVKHGELPEGGQTGECVLRFLFLFLSSVVSGRKFQR